MYVAGISSGLGMKYIDGQKIIEIHNVVGYGVIYILMFINIIPSTIVGLLAVTLVKKQVSAANAFVVIIPMLILYFPLSKETLFNPSAVQMAITHPLLAYIAIRIISPKIHVPISVLGVNCRPVFYPALLIGIIVCAPITLFFFYGKSYQEVEFSWSYMFFGMLSVIFFITKKHGCRTLESLSVILLMLAIYSIYLHGPSVIETMVIASTKNG